MIIANDGGVWVDALGNLGDTPAPDVRESSMDGRLPGHSSFRGFLRDEAGRRASRTGTVRNAGHGSSCRAPHVSSSVFCSRFSIPR